MRRSSYDHVEALGRFFEFGAEDVGDEEDNGNDKEKSPVRERLSDGVREIN